ncbi:MAG TPA: Gfo/Idh/MocA family oxidoreductase [Bryobacteraceae bacterium]|nr:Gfo/Idh/MocA family oxidoreductase [Bryobacteraceae bacterium]
MRRLFTLFLFPICLVFPQSNEPHMRIAIAGLVHGHVAGFLNAVRDHPNVEIVGIFEPDTELQARYRQQYAFVGSIFFTDLGKMLAQVKPDAVATFTSTYHHPMVVEACAMRHTPVMMEKPLAVSMEHARAIRKAADRGGIPVIVNYETTWYRSHGAMWDLVKTQHAGGDIRKMVAMDGHEGPREINVQPEFFGWLTDPVKNGAGALFDFGCYGANLMTWMMDNQRPIAVTAVTQRIKPQIYPRVDDEATILVEYPKAQGIIQASWNWPFSRKDFEVYTKAAYAIAVGGNTLRVRMPKEQEETRTPATLPAEDQDSLSYLASVVINHRKPAGLSSLENNMIVTEILDTARESARTGRTIRLR